MLKRNKIFKIFTIIMLSVFNLLLYGVNNPALAVTPVDIYFNPDTAIIPPETSFKLMIDPKGQTISFLQITIFFDTTKLQLSSDVVVNSPLLTVYSPPTPKSEANTTGLIRLIVYQNPGSPAQNSTFEISSIPFTYISQVSPTATDVTIVDEQTQIVDNSTPPNILPFNVNYATVNLQGGAAPKGFAAFMAMFKGSCASSEYIDTAIGCIPVKDQNAMAKFFLSWGLGIAGGIAFILIIYAAFQIMTSSGDPRKLQAGKELLTAALSGLVLLVTAAFILRLIGIDILSISGF